MVTSIKDMVRTGGPQEVAISGWAGETITVKLQRPSLYAMAKGGRIPNPLLPVAESLFMMNGSKIQKLEIDDMAGMMDLIAREALAEPTYDEIREAGLELTDTQYNEIYAFTIGGAAALAAFRRNVRSVAGGYGTDNELPGGGAAGA